MPFRSNGVFALALLLNATAVYAQTATAGPKPEERLVPGVYDALTKATPLAPLILDIRTVDPGSGLPSGFTTQFYGSGAYQGTGTFGTHIGADGYPEAKYHSGNVWNHIRMCGQGVVCVNIFLHKEGFTSRDTLTEQRVNDVQFVSCQMHLSDAAMDRDHMKRCADRRG